MRKNFKVNPDKYDKNSFRLESQFVPPPFLSPSIPSSRFIRGKVSFAEQSERESPPKGSSVVNMLYGSKALRDAYSSIVKLYESFVGPIHFRAMSRLLGYQGIAMIMEQLLHIIDGQVCVRVCVCVRARVCDSSKLILNDLW